MQVFKASHKPPDLWTPAGAWRAPATCETRGARPPPRRALRGTLTAWQGTHGARAWLLPGAGGARRSCSGLSRAQGRPPPPEERATTRDRKGCAEAVSTLFSPTNSGFRTGRSANPWSKVTYVNRKWTVSLRASARNAEWSKNTGPLTKDEPVQRTWSASVRNEKASIDTFQCTPHAKLLNHDDVSSFVISTKPRSYQLGGPVQPKLSPPDRGPSATPRVLSPRW